jgi:hypothetical protein
MAWFHERFLEIEHGEAAKHDKRHSSWMVLSSAAE